jgi:hypothetical protein
MREFIEHAFFGLVFLSIGHFIGFRLGVRTVFNGLSEAHKALAKDNDSTGK